MTATVASKSLAVLTLSIMQMAFGDEQSGRRAQSESTDLAKLAPGGVIRIANSSGYLFVEAWDRQEVEVTVIKWIDHEFEPHQFTEATHRLQDKSVNVEHNSDQEVRISAVTAHSNLFTHSFGRVAIKYHIFAPRYSRLVIDHHGGYVLLSGLAGEIDVANRRGDILVMLPNLASFAIDARNKFGIVTADLTGKMRHEYIMGERFSRDQQPKARHLRLRMGVGGITIKEIPPEGEPPISSALK